MEHIVSTSLDYKKYQLTYLQYQFSKCLPVSGGNTFNISAAGTEVLIEFPVKAINLARSILYFQLSSIDNGGAGQIGAGLQQWYPASCLSLFRQVQLYTRSNVYVADLYEVQNLTEVMWKPFTKQSNFLTNDQSVNRGAGASSIPTTMNNSGFARFLQPSYINLANLANHRHDNSLPQLSSYEPLHFYTTNTVSAGTIAPIPGSNTGSFVLNCEIPLGMLYDSIFAVDKDILFNEVMVLRLVFNGTNRIAFTTVAGDLTNPTAIPAVPGFTMVIQNLCLYLAVEQNAAIENDLRAKIHSGEGFSMLVPYIYSTKLGLPASTSQSMSVRYNREHGLKLKKILYAPFNTVEQLNTVYDHSNLSNVGVAGAKINNFYIQIDNQRLQQFNVDCTNLSGQSLDYLCMQQFLKGSILCTSNLYQYN